MILTNSQLPYFTGGSSVGAQAPEPPPQVCTIAICRQREQERKTEIFNDISTQLKGLITLITLFLFHVYQLWLSCYHHLVYRFRQRAYIPRNSLLAEEAIEPHLADEQLMVLTDKKLMVLPNKINFMTFQTMSRTDAFLLKMYTCSWRLGWTETARSWTICPHPITVSVTVSSISVTRAARFLINAC